MRCARTEAPSSKSQHPEKLQEPSPKTGPRRLAGLVLGAWSFSGAWMLELGASAAAWGCRLRGGRRLLRRLHSVLRAWRWWRRSHELVRREHAVAVFVQRLEYGAGVGDFLGVNHAIVIGIQSANDRRCRGMMAVPARAAGTGRGSLRGRLRVVWRRHTRVLRQNYQPRSTQGNGRYRGFDFVVHT